MSHQQQFTINALGSLLALVAGALNAGGFLAFGYYTSHMTGIASSIADNIALQQLDMVLNACGFLLAFIAGATATAIIVNFARTHHYRNVYVPVLLLEGVLLLSIGVLAPKQLAQIGGDTVLPVLLLCFVMGLQNAMITKVSRAVIRTTHITGLVTDIGIELGRAIYQRCSKKALPDARLSYLWLYVWLVSAFIAGGILGAYLFAVFGFSATILLAILLMSVAVLLVADAKV